MTELITWVGMDAHKEFINVAIRYRGEQVFVEAKIANEQKAIKRLARQLERDAGGEVRCCYEAGPCGYGLHRALEANASVVCDVVAPALIPRKPGDRVKTDRRDARKLCELYQAGLLTTIARPTPDQEALRDLFRCRGAAKDDLIRTRHRVLKFLLRRGIHYTEGHKTWTKEYRRWVRTVRFASDVDQAVFDDYLLAVEQLHQRVTAIEAKIQDVADRAPNRERVALLRCFRGVSTITAFGIQAELFDFARFDSPRKLASYLGITPGEYSSSGKPHRGRITKAGNGHVRRLLIEAAWHYRHRPAVGPELRKRREGQPAEVIAIADKAQHRLYRRYQRLIERRMPPVKAVVAIARELSDFLWAAAYESSPEVANAS